MLIAFECTTCEQFWPFVPSIKFTSRAYKHSTKRASMQPSCKGKEVQKKKKHTLLHALAGWQSSTAFPFAFLGGRRKINVKCLKCSKEEHLIVWLPYFTCEWPRWKELRKFSLAVMREGAEETRACALASRILPLVSWRHLVCHKWKRDGSKAGPWRGWAKEPMFVPSATRLGIRKSPFF